MDKEQARKLGQPHQTPSPRLIGGTVKGDRGQAQGADDQNLLYYLDSKPDKNQIDLSSSGIMSAEKPAINFLFSL